MNKPVPADFAETFVAAGPASIFAYPGSDWLAVARWIRIENLDRESGGRPSLMAEWAQQLVNRHTRKAVASSA